MNCVIATCMLIASVGIDYTGTTKPGLDFQLEQDKLLAGIEYTRDEPTSYIGLQNDFSDKFGYQISKHSNGDVRHKVIIYLD